jgi:hypothetical protein
MRPLGSKGAVHSATESLPLPFLIVEVDEYELAE